MFFYVSYFFSDKLPYPNRHRWSAQNYINIHAKMDTNRMSEIIRLVQLSLTDRNLENKTGNHSRNMIGIMSLNGKKTSRIFPPQMSRMQRSVRSHLNLLCSVSVYGFPNTYYRTRDSYKQKKMWMVIKGYQGYYHLVFNFFLVIRYGMANKGAVAN